MRTRLLALVTLALSVAPCVAQPVLDPGVAVSGALSHGDPKLDDGSYYDLYQFDVRAGAEYTVELRSDAFDAYLAAGQGGDVMEWLDDDGGGGTDARLTFTAPSSGRYVVRANSLLEGMTGPYTLVLAASAPDGRGPGAGPSPSFRTVGPLVQTQLERAAGLMGTQGFAMEGAVRPGALADGTQELVSLELRGGREYVVVGACDGDCSDLDLALVGPDGEAVGSDYERDDVPMVSASAARGGTYRLTVSMAACSADPCGYGVAVFARQ